MKYFTLLLIMFMTASCTHLLRHYDYERDAVSIENGRIEAKLTGSWNKISEEPEITERRNPYSLVIYVFSNEIDIPVEISVEKAHTASGKVFLINKKTSGITRKPVPDWEPFTTLIFNGLELVQHESITITGTVLLKGHLAKFEMTLHPKYSERKTNNTYEAVMGI